MKNPNWSEEELILALDLYFKCPEAIGRNDHPSVKKLSDDLQKLKVHPLRERTPKFRNPNGVALKLSNFARLDPSAGAGSPHGNRQEEKLWDSYAHDPEALRKQAHEIREAHGLYEPLGLSMIAKIDAIRSLLDELETML